MGKYLAIIFTILSSCITGEKATHFTKFPEHFSALQILEIHSKGGVQKVLANLERNTFAFYSVVFIHPLFQAPLLSLKFQKNKTTVKKLYDKLPDSVPGEKILDAIRQLYDADSFIFTERSTTQIGHLTTDTINYTLTDFENFAQNGLCIFPRFIAIHAKDNSVMGNLRVESKEVTCL